MTLIFDRKLNEKSGELSIAQLCTVHFRSSTQSIFKIILFFSPRLNTLQVQLKLSVKPSNFNHDLFMRVNLREA